MSAQSDCYSSFDSPSAEDSDSETYYVEAVGSWDNRYLSRLYNNKQFSDCKIVCGTMTLDAHCCILGSACEFFEKAFCGGFKEGKDKVLDLSDDKPEYVQALVKFAYGHGNFLIFQSETPSMEDLLGVFVLADRLGYNTLRCRLLRDLERACDRAATSHKDFEALLLVIARHHLLRGPVRDDLISRYAKTNVLLMAELSPDDQVKLVAQVPDIFTTVLSMAKDLVENRKEVAKRRKVYPGA